MAEVEAQLVRADVGAGLAHVVAEALAQRGVQQVRRGVVALSGVARRVVDAREHGLAGVQLAPLEHDRERLVVAEAKDALDARRQSPCSHSITPASETWPPPAA